MANKFSDRNGKEDFSMYYPDGDAANMDRDDHDDAFINQNIRRKKMIRKKNAQLSKSQKTLILVIFIVYTVIIFAAAWLIFYQPGDAGEHEIPFDTSPVATEDPNKPPLDGDETEDEGNGKEPVVEDPYLPVDGLYNILVVGHDDTALLADVAMIVHCNTNDGSISVVQIPRDTLVTLDLLTNKNNEAFSHYYVEARREGLKDPYAEAGKRYADLLESSLCIKIHHNVIMDLSGFRSIVDAIGGVDVYVPEAMEYEDPEQDLYIHIGDGWQHLDGYNAEGFIRFRMGYVQADLGRVNAQKIFLTAMFNKVKSIVKSADVATLNNLAGAIFKSVTTDMNLSDIIFYAKFMLDVNLDDIHMMTAPGDIAGAFFVINRQGMLDVVNEYLNIYNKDITDSIFDRNFTFCFTDQDYLKDVYYAETDMGYGQVYDGDKIDDSSIVIPRN